MYEKRAGIGPYFFKRIGHPQPLFIYFRLFKQTLQFLRQINVKNVHPVFSTGIQTHDLQKVSLLP